jgi:hypothetical protein
MCEGHVLESQLGMFTKWNVFANNCGLNVESFQCVLCGKFPVPFICETGIEIITKIVLI